MQQTGSSAERVNARPASLRRVHVCRESDYSIDGCTSLTQAGVNPHSWEPLTG